MEKAVLASVFGFLGGYNLPLSVLTSAEHGTLNVPVESMNSTVRRSTSRFYLVTLE